MLGDIASNIKARIIREMSHAPVSFVAAIVTLVDVSAKLIAGSESHLPPSGAAQSPQSLDFPEPTALLEYLGFLVVIAFIADWLNDRAIRFGASAAVIVGLFTAVLTAYLLNANAFQLASFLILKERSNAGAFVGGVLIGSMIIFALMSVFIVERNYNKVGAWDLGLMLMYRMAPFLLLLMASISFFESMFEARLQALYNSLLNR